MFMRNLHESLRRYEQEKWCKVEITYVSVHFEMRCTRTPTFKYQTFQNYYRSCTLNNNVFGWIKCTICSTKYLHEWVGLDFCSKTPNDRGSINHWIIYSHIWKIGEPLVYNKWTPYILKVCVFCIEKFVVNQTQT